MSGTAALAPMRQTRIVRSVRVPALLELLALVAVIALLLPSFGSVAETGGGRDRRFVEPAGRIEGLPDDVLPSACARVAPQAEPALRERFCGARSGGSATALPPALPTDVAQAAVRAAEAFAAPLRAYQARLEGLREGERGTSADVLGTADAIGALEAEVQPLIERFQLSGSGGPQPLVCTRRGIEGVLADGAGPVEPAQGRDLARANAVLLFAAALDGRRATEGLAQTAVLPVARIRPAPPCDERVAAALGATAAVMADARLSVSNARKNEATLALFATAGWQWAGAMALGYGLLVWSRRARTPAFGIAAALALWAAAAWIARVPWPLAGSRGFEPGRLDAALDSPPAPFVLALGGAAAAVFIAALWTRRRAQPAPVRDTLSSRIGYAGFALASGLGWLLLLDLSANGQLGNRYLALYHQGHLWLGLLVLSVLLFLRRPLARELGWLLSIGGESVRAATRRLGPLGAGVALVVVALAAVVACGVAFANMRQLTSELGRIWLIVGAAWFFFLRAGPLTERLARAGSTGRSFWRYAWPMLFVVGVLVAAMAVTRDMGPLLIAGYGSGAFLAAALAMWWHERSGQRWSAFALAVLLFAGWIAAVTWTLFEIGSVDSLTATRLESVAAPFASTNDQLALVAWFQRAAPAEGFGLGAVPWCGYAAAAGCSGVPAQIHSDYTFTAIVGVFGALAAWAASLGCALWLHRLIRHHARVTRGEPRLLQTPAGSVLDGQAFISWIAVAWVVLTSCQLAVTVAGNVAVLPLTGVTFPFVSFGMTSLLVNLAFLALCLSVDAPVRSGHA